MIQPTFTNIREMRAWLRDRTTSAISLSVAVPTAFVLGFLDGLGFFRGLRTGLSVYLIDSIRHGAGHRLRLEAALDELRDLVDSSDYDAFISPHQEAQFRFIIETLDKALR